MSEKNVKNCKNCKYFIREEHSICNDGKCFAYPPTVIDASYKRKGTYDEGYGTVTQNSSTNKRPNVQEEDFCSLFKKGGK